MGIERVCQGKGYDGERFIAQVLYNVGHGWGSLAKAQPMPRFGVRVGRETKSIAPVGEGLQRHCQKNQYVAGGKVSCSSVLWAAQGLVTSSCSSTVRVTA